MYITRHNLSNHEFRQTQTDTCDIIRRNNNTFILKLFVVIVAYHIIYSRHYECNNKTTTPFGFEPSPFKTDSTF